MNIFLSKYIPNLISFASLILSTYSVIYNFYGYFKISIFLIICSCLLDGVDGKVARSCNVSSNFGTYIDSFVDSYNFGIIPALHLYFWMYKDNFIYILIIYILTTFMRLSMFNTSSLDISFFKNKNFFCGVPMPLTAILLIIPIYLSTNTYDYKYFIFLKKYILLYIVFNIFLSISTLKIPYKKNNKIIYSIITVTNLFILLYISTIF